jgi:benzoyl-CoA reductase/2-hydroxyglutaryl-CoA dehydratase subunit BcrC/BadD/HgdB
MNELLRLFGYRETELESELPRIRKTFKKLGINAGDIERGKQRLTMYYDIKFEGVRKAFRLCMQEMVDVMLSREEGKKKVIYGFMAPTYNGISTALTSQSREVCSTHLCWVFHLILGCVFDKMVPVFEAAEKNWLKAGVVAHCGNVKSLLGLIVMDLIPKPDLLISSGLLCETAPKTLDLLHEIYDIPVCYCETCQDREANEYQDATRRIAILTSTSSKKLVEDVQRVTGITITDKILLDAINRRGELDRAINKLKDFVRSSDPLPISTSHDNLWMALSSLSFNSESLQEAIEAVKTTHKEVQEKVRKGLGVVKKGAPRILALCPPPHADPRLDQLVLELGMAIVASDLDIFMPDAGIVKSNDPYSRMSGILQNSLSTNTAMKIPLLIEGCHRLNISGVLDRFHVGCRTVAGDALIIDEAIRKKLGLPVMVLEWENFDPRVYNHDQYKQRLEVFKTMITARKTG